MFEAADIMISRARPAASRNIIAVAETKARLPKAKSTVEVISHKQVSNYRIKFNKVNQRLFVKRLIGFGEAIGYFKTISLYCVATLISAFLIYGSVAAVDIHFAKEALVNGKPVGVVKNTAEFERLIEDMRISLSTTLGKEVDPAPKPVYIARLVFGKDLTSEYALRQNILSTFEEAEEAYAIYVNDTLICAALNEETARNALERIKRQHIDEGVEAETEFAENVSIRKEFIPVGYIRSEDGIYSALTSTREAPKTYTVSAKDTIWGIANKFGMSIDEIFSLNKDLSETIHEGDEIIINKSEPLLSVKAKYVYEGERAIPYESNEVQDSSIPLGKKVVVSEGTEGKKYVIEQVVMVNGEVTETNIISEEIISQPVAATVKVGTKKDLSTVAVSGKLARPVYGTISSRFGRRGRSFHSGLDIAAPTGTPIKAADGGTVSFTGWSSGYGYLVKINHGGGYETYYAHCSQILAKTGEKVSKGDVIAKVGNTGRSTGPHCHFEVRVNGVAQNPSNYIN